MKNTEKFHIPHTLFPAFLPNLALSVTKYEHVTLRRFASSQRSRYPTKNNRIILEQISIDIVSYI